MATIDGWLFVLKLVSALGCGLIAGAFFAFSSFVMRALSRLPANEGMAAMQSINIVVLNPVFLGVFVGTAALCAAGLVVAFLRWHEPGAGWLLAGSLLYLLGTFLVTVVFNVPLNDALGAVSPTAAGAQDLWATYLDRWTPWNHVRTVAALAATASFILALLNKN